MRIYEYVLVDPRTPFDGRVTLNLPDAARILCVSRHRLDGAVIYLLARVDGNEKHGTDERHFKIVLTGQDFDDTLWLYIGSVEWGGAWAHVFEDVRVRED